MGKRSRLKNCTLIGPVMIGDGVSCADSRIGPNVSIGDDVVLNRATIRESILLSGAEVEEVSSQTP